MLFLLYLHRGHLVNEIIYTSVYTHFLMAGMIINLNVLYRANVWCIYKQKSIFITIAVYMTAWGDHADNDLFVHHRSPADTRRRLSTSVTVRYYAVAHYNALWVYGEVQPHITILQQRDQEICVYKNVFQIIIYHILYWMLSFNACLAQ